MIRSSVMLFCVLTAVTRVDAVENRIIATVSTSQSHAEIHSHAQFVRRSIQPEWMHLAWLDIGAIRGKDVKSVSVDGHTLYPQADNHTRYAMHLAGDSVIANVHVTFEREKAWSSEFLARAGQTYALQFHAAGAALLFADVPQATIEVEVKAAESTWWDLVSQRRSALARRNVLQNEIRDAKSERDRNQKLIPPRIVSIKSLNSDYQIKQTAAVQAESQADAACRKKDAAQQHLNEQNTLLKLASELEKKSQGPQKNSAKLLLADVTQSQLDANQAFIVAETNCNNASTTARIRRNEADAAKAKLLAEQQAKSKEQSEFDKYDEIVKVSRGRLVEIDRRIQELNRTITETEIEIRTLKGLLATSGSGGVTNSGTPGGGTPGAGAPGGGTPGDGTPGAGTPDGGTPGGGTPGAEGTPDGTPGGTSDGGTPGDTPGETPGGTEDSTSGGTPGETTEGTEEGGTEPAP